MTSYMIYIIGITKKLVMQSGPELFYFCPTKKNSHTRPELSYAASLLLTKRNVLRAPFIYLA